MFLCKSAIIPSSSSSSSSLKFFLGSPSCFCWKKFTLQSLVFTSPVEKFTIKTMPPKPLRNAFELLMSRSKKRATQESKSSASSINPNQLTRDEPGSNKRGGGGGAEEDSGNLNSSDSINKTSSSSAAKKPKLTVTPDQSISELKKKAAEFDYQRAAFWGKGEKVPFLFVAKVLDVISEESRRIAVTEITCNMLRTVMETTPEDLVRVVYFLTDQIAPAHEGLQLGIGDAIITKALAESYGTTELTIKENYKKLGDLGEVAIGCRSSQSVLYKPEALTVAKVFETFHTIAKESGKDSQTKKRKAINKLLVAASDCEPKYLIRLLQQNLRIGSGSKTLLAALGHAALYTTEKSLSPASMSSRLDEAANILKQVYSVRPVYDEIIAALLSGSIWDLPKKCYFTPGVPIGPMLAKATKAVSEILDKFQNIEFTCEYKYDGERAQIHYLEDGSVEIYSRNAERNTQKYPDVVSTISRLKDPSVTSFVIDGEIVAYDRENKKILPFQVLSTRARKNVETSGIKVEVCIYAFDILYMNGKSLLKEQLQTRRKHLYESFKEEPGYFQFSVAITSNDVEEIQKFLDASVEASCEGLIIKTLDKEATYEPSKRSNNWLKLKKDYIDSIGDSLDLVPIGGFHGRGKRTGVYGAFLLACYDQNKEEFQSICKVGSGFTEANLEEYANRLRSNIIPTPKSYYRYSDSLLPDVWFEPIEVWEVKAADLTLSNKNCAAIGIVDPDKGISLRFPRILRVREDKSPEDATSSEMVAEMFSAQKQHRKSVVKDDEDDDE